MISQPEYETIDNVSLTDCFNYNSLEYISPNNTDVMLYDWNNYMVTPRLNHDHPERGIAGFVSKLYQCLQDNEQSYARWCKHNGIDMFIIDNIPEFTETVLPKLFKHCKFASFVRQLNIYGFQRDTDARKSKDSKGRDTCRWYHKYFRPGRRDLFHLIRRKPPRYSRGRRQQRVDKNSEVILSMESEDEVSESNKDQRRNSISSISSSSVTLHPTAPQQSSREGSQSTFLVQGPAILSPSTTLTPSTQYQPLYYPTDLPSSYSISQPLAQKEAFQNQLACLQEKYTRVYTVLTDEINRAYSFIEAQKSRIKFLENSLQQQGSLNDPVPLAYRSPSSSSVDGTNMVLQSHCHETYSTPLYNIIQQSYLSPSRSSSSTGHMNPQSMYMLSNEDLQGIPTSNSLLQNDDNSLLL